MLLLDTRRAPETFVPSLLARYLEPLDAPRRAEVEAALSALADPRAPEELLIELLEVSPDESIPWLRWRLRDATPEQEPELLARLAVLGELVQLAEERYLDPAALEDARARYGQTLGDALRELLSRP